MGIRLELSFRNFSVLWGDFLVTLRTGCCVLGVSAVDNGCESLTAETQRTQRLGGALTTQQVCLRVGSVPDLHIKAPTVVAVVVVVDPEEQSAIRGNGEY